MREYIYTFVCVRMTYYKPKPQARQKLQIEPNWNATVNLERHSRYGASIATEYFYAKLELPFTHVCTNSPEVKMYFIEWVYIVWYLICKNRVFSFRRKQNRFLLEHILMNSWRPIELLPPIRCMCRFSIILDYPDVIAISVMCSLIVALYTIKYVLSSFDPQAKKHKHTPLCSHFSVQTGCLICAHKYEHTRTKHEHPLEHIRTAHANPVRRVT